MWYIYLFIPIFPTDYIFKEEKVIMSWLDFGVSTLTDNHYIFEKINKVEPDYIYFEAFQRWTSGAKQSVKCSLESLICEHEE